ncbi:hypothetical protein BS47DRAFT_1437509 [Hydnum rufescens UP504]|uniref:Uncharacterized protein n=1 Tax=Hydnum rufescens UP504 TaxID=1448309 RepID=A0A9P6AGS2_9AGAM|nr:hypothetical protein BS47DRAFT_1437509 [Hydnum rufescens UP504]
MEAHEYAPTMSVEKFREVVANSDNIENHQGKESKYTYENVCIVPGGPISLSRVAAVIGDVYVGHQVPKYTTYSEPGEYLDKLVHLCKPHMTIILDEVEHAVYSHSILDVNEDSVVIIDGLTKNLTPSWRTCWVIGPKNLISTLSQSEMGLPVKTLPVATFYIWLDLSNLPNPLNNGLTFFKVLLKEKTVVIPGIFFKASSCRPQQGCMFFFLPAGLDTIKRVLEWAQEEGIITFGHSSISGPREPVSYTTEGLVFLQKDVAVAGFILAAE